MKAKYLLSLITIILVSAFSLFSQELQFTVDPNSYTYSKGDTLIQEYFTHCGGVGYKVEIEGGTPPYTITWQTKNATVINSDSVFAEPVNGYSIAKCTVKDANLDSIYKQVYIYNKVFHSGLPLKSMEKDTSYWLTHKPMLAVIAGKGIYLDNVKKQYYFRPDSAKAGTHEIKFSYAGPTISDPDSTCIGEDEDPFTIEVFPKLQVSVSGGNFCQWMTVGSFANVSGGIPPYTYTWTGNGTPSNNWFSMYAGVAGTEFVSCKVTDSQGNTVSGSSQIIIYPLPTVTISHNPEVCEFENTVITANAFSFWGGPTSYSWSGSGSAYLSNTNSANPSFFGALAGTYDISVTVTDINGCQNDATSTIEVNPTPTVNISPINNLCQHDPAVQLTATVWPTFGAGKWTGSVSGNGVFNPAVANVGPNTVTYSYAVNGCTATATANITVFATPAPPIIPSLNPLHVCIGDLAISLTALGNPGSIIQWKDFGTQNIIFTGKNFPQNTTTSGTLQYWVTQTDIINMCESNGTPVQVIINANPNPTITSTVDLDNADGTPISLGVTNTGANISQYSWTGSAAAYLNGTSLASPTFSGYPAGSHIITAEVTDIHGCKGNTTETITYNAPLTPTITGITSKLCLGADLVLGVSGGSFATYAWSTTGNGISFSATNIATPIITALEAGTFDISVTVTDGNGNTGTHTTVMIIGEFQPTFVIPSVPNPIYTTTSPFSLNPAPFHTFSGIGISEPATFNPSIAGVGMHEITVIVNNPNACGNAKTSAFSIEVKESCEVNADFTISFNQGNNSYEFKALEENNHTYEWYLPDGTEFKGTDKQTITHKFNTSIESNACLTVINTANTECKETICKNHSFVEQGNLYSIEGTVMRNNNKITCGNVIAFKYISDSYIAVDTVEVADNGTYIFTNCTIGYYIILAEPCHYLAYQSTYFHNSLTLENATSFYLSDNATSVDINLVPLATELQNFTADSKITVYPNPMEVSATIELENIDATEIQIVSITGAILRTIPIKSNSLVIQREQLPSGRYIFVVKNKNGDLTQQNVIIK